MDYPNLYLVSFDIKHGRSQHTTTYVINASACNATEAKNKAKSLWEKDHDSHMFHLCARRLKEGENFMWNYFVVNPLVTDARDIYIPETKILSYIETQKSAGHKRNFIIAALNTFGVSTIAAEKLYNQTENQVPEHKTTHHR